MDLKDTLSASSTFIRSGPGNATASYNFFIATTLLKPERMQAHLWQQHGLQLRVAASPLIRQNVTLRWETIHALGAGPGGGPGGSKGRCLSINQWRQLRGWLYRLAAIVRLLLIPLSVCWVQTLCSGLQWGVAWGCFNHMVGQEQEVLRYMQFSSLSCTCAISNVQKGTKLLTGTLQSSVCVYVWAVPVCCSSSWPYKAVANLQSACGVISAVICHSPWSSYLHIFISDCLTIA